MSDDIRPAAWLRMGNGTAKRADLENFQFCVVSPANRQTAVHTSEQDRPHVAERREAWRQMQKSFGGRLIFLDETFTTTAMTRRHAWTDVGARAIGHAPNGHWKTTTFLAGLT